MEQLLPYSQQFYQEFCSSIPALVRLGQECHTQVEDAWVVLQEAHESKNSDLFLGGDCFQVADRDGSHTRVGFDKQFKTFQSLLLHGQWVLIGFNVCCLEVSLSSLLSTLISRRWMVPASTRVAKRSLPRGK